VQPVLQLEGQRGKARRERVARILGPHRGAALAMQTAFATIESALVMGLLALLPWLMRPDDQTPWLALLFEGARG
jgi:hypothetical protein